MPLSEDDKENEACAECALDSHPEEFRIYGPDGWESWSFLSDGTFLVTDDEGPTYQYIYPYCICTERRVAFELDDEESVCYLCKTDE